MLMMYENHSMLKNDAKIPPRNRYDLLSEKIAHSEKETKMIQVRATAWKVMTGSISIARKTRGEIKMPFASPNPNNADDLIRTLDLESSVKRM